MALQYSVAVRNAQLDAFETACGASAVLKIRTGAVPAKARTISLRRVTSSAQHDTRR